MQRALTSGPITGSILLGLCIGSGAAISMQYGSGEYDKMRQSVFQSFALIAGMALADAIGIGYYLVKIEHIALYVNDLEAAKDFFVRYFDAVPNAGYHNPRTDFRSYFLTFADGARLELMNKPGMSDEPKPAARTGYAHIAFSVGSQEKVDALTARLKADGCEVLSGPRTTGDGYYESCVLAVEGNQIEITV